MFVRVVYGAGRQLAGLTFLIVLLIMVSSALVQAHGSPVLASGWMAAFVVVGVPVCVVVHEAGHLLTCLALRVEVYGVEIGSGKSHRLRFTVRGVEVSLGLLGGAFGAALRTRDAEGSLPRARTPAVPHANPKLVLHQQGRPLPPEQAAKWLTAYWQREPLALPAVGFVGRSLRLRGLITELLELHADLPQPTGPHARKLTVAAHMLDWEVLMVPGLPANVVDRAVSRVQWVLHTAEFEPDAKLWSREAVLHTLALGKLRQGHFAEAEELCQPILARPDLGARSRATVLATVVLARRALGLPYHEELTEARSLGPSADLVAEATAPASAKAPDPGPAGTRQLQGT